MSEIDEREARVDFSKKLRNLLNEHQKTATDLIEYTGASKTVVYSWLNGECFPRMNMLVEIANFFGMDYADLFSHSESNNMNEARKIMQQMYDTPEMRVLFSATQNAKPEDILYVAELLEKLKGGKK